MAVGFWGVDEGICWRFFSVGMGVAAALLFVRDGRVALAGCVGVFRFRSGTGGNGGGGAGASLVEPEGACGGRGLPLGNLS